MEVRKLCACGCGRLTPRAAKTDGRRGNVKGRPTRFIQGHQHRIHTPGQWNAHEPSWYLQREQERRQA